MCCAGNMVVLRHDFFADEAIKCSDHSRHLIRGDGGQRKRVRHGGQHQVSCGVLRSLSTERHPGRRGKSRVYPLSWRLRRITISEASGSSNAHIRGAEYVSSKKSDAKRSLTITAKLKGVKGTLDQVEEAYWEETPLGKSQVV